MVVEKLAIQVDKLTKDYNGFRAVDQVSFSVSAGKMFGFLGPNGAGKTTTIKMLCTLLRPTSGDAFVSGFSVLKEPMKVRQSIGIIFQEHTLDERLTVVENLKFHGILYGLKGRRLDLRIEEMLELVGLSDKKEKFVKTFSGGMKRRLEIARGLLHTPNIIFLDEPTVGLDPQTRVYIWEYLHRLKQNQQFTLFLTTHYMEEAENCDEIAIIDQGRVVAMDTPANLKGDLKGDILVLKTDENLKLAEYLEEKYGLKPEIVDDKIEVEVKEVEKWLPNFLRESPVSVQELSLHPPTLEDVFIHLTGREIREEEGNWKDQFRAAIRRRRRK